MGQVGLLVKTEVTRIVTQAEISPEMFWRVLGEDLVAAPVDFVAKGEQKAPQSFCSLSVALGIS